MGKWNDEDEKHAMGKEKERLVREHLSRYARSQFSMNTGSTVSSSATLNSEGQLQGSSQRWLGRGASSRRSNETNDDGNSHEEKNDVNASNHGEEVVESNVVGRMFGRKSISSGDDDEDEDDEENIAVGSLSSQVPPPPRRNENRVVRSDRPGAVHMRGRAYGGLPAWARRRLEQERLRLSMAAAVPPEAAVQNAQTTVVESSRDDDDDSDSDGHDQSTECGGRTYVATGHTAQTVVEATTVKASQEYDDEFDAKISGLRKRTTALTLCCASMIVGVVAILTTVAVLLRNPRHRYVRPPTPAPTTMIPSLLPSMAPTSTHWNHLYTLLKTISSEEDLQDPESIQYKALRFLETDRLVQDGEMPESRLLERYICLCTFYRMIPQRSVPDPQWDFANLDTCDLGSVTCGPDRHITKFAVFAFRHNFPNEFDFSQGKIPSELGHLTRLRALVMHNNLLTGTVPSTLGSNATQLRYLKLFNNSLEGPLPPEFARHAHLEEISLSGNLYFGGTVPTVLATLPRLKRLYIDDCGMHGTIPSVFASLSSLEVLGLAGNELTGSIPHEFAQFKHLSRLELSHNQLTGSISFLVEASFPSLFYVSVENNHLNGTISDIGLPLSWGQDKLHSRKIINLSDNRLQGSIPKAFASWNNLVGFKAHNNDFHGTMPDEYCDLFRTTVQGQNSVASLVNLTADCGSGRKRLWAKVECRCCSSCF